MAISFLAVIGYLTTSTSLVILLLSRIRSPDLKWLQNHDHDHEVSLFVFGDSIFDGGTNNYINTVTKANVVPYGESFFSYPTGRFSDGRLIPDFIAEYAGLPLLPPYLQPNYTFSGGVNFASAGSGALAETNLNVLDLGTQHQQFEQLVNQLKMELGDQKAKETISKAVYLISVGGNDLVYAYTSSITYEVAIAMVIGNVTDMVKSIHAKGGTKFGFLNVMPLGCTPYNRASTSNGTCVDELNRMARIYNINFMKALDELEIQLDGGFKYSIFDFYDTLQQRINHPSSYGIEEGTIACCGTNNASPGCAGQTTVLCEDPSKYVFFDCFHPTQKVYKQLAHSMWTGDQDVIRPYNLRSLFYA